METNIIYHPENTRSFKDMGWIKLYQGLHPAHPPAPNRRNFGKMVIFDNGFIMPGGKGFGMHPHQNMEILSVVIKGAMVHSDTAGHNGINVQNAVQLISAGIGVQHSEYNYSETEEIDNLQIWFLPKVQNIAPRYQTMQSSFSSRDQHLQLLVSPDAENGSLQINQDVWVWRGTFNEGKNLTFSKKASDHLLYLFLIDGEANVQNQTLRYRDGLGLVNQDDIAIDFLNTTDILIIEVNQ